MGRIQASKSICRAGHLCRGCGTLWQWCGRIHYGWSLSCTHYTVVKWVRCHFFKRKTRTCHCKREECHRAAKIGAPIIFPRTPRCLIDSMWRGVSWEEVSTPVQQPSRKWLSHDGAAARNVPVRARKMVRIAMLLQSSIHQPTCTNWTDMRFMR